MRPGKVEALHLSLRVTKQLVTAGFEGVRGAHLVTAIGDDTRKVCRPIDPDRL